MNPQPTDQAKALRRRSAASSRASSAPVAPPPVSGHHILGFSPDRWPHADSDAPLALLRRLALTNRVGYVDGANPDAPAGQSYTHFTQRFGIVNRRGQPQDADAINGVPPWWPVVALFTQRDREDVLNLPLVAELCDYCDGCGLRPTLIWTFDPAALLLRPWFPRAKFIYHVLDDLHRRPYGRDRFAIQRRHHSALTAADHVICATESLAAAVRPLRPDAVVVRSGLGLLSVPYIPTIPDFDDWVTRPAVLCAGPFSRHHDPTLVAACAAALPDVNFIVAGDNASSWLGDIAARPNVHVFDDCPLSQLPRFLCQVSACLLVIRARSWLALSQPPQLPFFLAYALPVISTAAPSVCMFDPGAVSIARSTPAFVALLRRALRSDSSAQRVRRQSAAQRFAWTRSLAQLADIVGPPPALSHESAFATFARLYHEQCWNPWSAAAADRRGGGLSDVHAHLLIELHIQRNAEIDARAAAASRQPSRGVRPSGPPSASGQPDRGVRASGLHPPAVGHPAAAPRPAAEKAVTVPPPAADGSPSGAAAVPPAAVPPVTAPQPGAPAEPASAVPQWRFRAKPPGRSKLREEEERIAKERDEEENWFHACGQS